MEQINPFALVRASDYSDEQINSLWVEMGSAAISTIIEPRSRISKFILGGKGTGKTHLLRYYSYPVIKLRYPSDSGISVIGKQKFLAIFLRATGVDAARFEASSEFTSKWQQLFGVYLELRLVEGVLDALCDIKATSTNCAFDDRAFISEMAVSVIDGALMGCESIDEFREWVVKERRRIDDAVNNAAFVGSLELRVPFSIGSLCLPISRAIGRWNPALSELPLIYLIDEIENFSASQQQVVNSLIRYGGGLSTFRVTGRLYARKTLLTLANGEENREGAEFKTTYLDDILRGYREYPDFAKRFVAKRLGSVGLITRIQKSSSLEFDPHSCFDEVSSNDFYSVAVEKLNFDRDEPSFIKLFNEAMKSVVSAGEAKEVARALTEDIPLLLQKLNLLLFCKKHKKNLSNSVLAENIRSDSIAYLNGSVAKKNYYATAYGHYAADLFAQLCRESKKVGSVPYAGFDTFVRMSSGNPRNLLIVLGRAYSIAAFKNIDFINGHKLSTSMQTEAAEEAARFMYEADTNFGNQSEQARNAVARLASILRTARYSLNIPEVSPLAVSFSEADLTDDSKRTLHSAMHYSFIFEISDGRPDRNSQKLNKKIQLNPLLSPRWGLPIARRGDISLSRELLNAVFDPRHQDEFELLLRGLHAKWNNPFKHTSSGREQGELF